MALGTERLRRTGQAAARGTEWLGVASRAGLLVVGLVSAGLLGALVSPHRKVAVLLGAVVLGAGILASDPVLVGILAVPATLLVNRLGGSAAGSSVDISDVMLALATTVALPMVRWDRARALRPVLHLALFYEAVILLSVVANPNSHDLLEWAHRLLLVAGSLVVGWVVATSGRARQALTALLAGSAVLALVTLEYALRLHFQAAQFGVYDKNYIGAMMWIAVIVAHVNPPWADIPPRFARVVKYLCLAALFASESKQSIIALAVVLVIATVRQPSLRRHSKALLFGLAPLAVFAYLASTKELTHFQQFNSLYYRIQAYDAALKVWLLNPWLGQGPRWFYLPQFAGNIQPPNIVLGALTSTGIVGLVALVVLLVGSVHALARLPNVIGTLALVVLVGRVVEAMFDIYWVSAAGALPWLIVGLALGVADAERRMHRDNSPGLLAEQRDGPRP